MTAYANEILLVAFIMFVMALLLLKQAEDIHKETEEFIAKNFKPLGDEDVFTDTDLDVGVDCFLTGKDSQKES